MKRWSDQNRCPLLIFLFLALAFPTFGEEFRQERPTEKLWTAFYDLCRIPRASKREASIAEWILGKAQARGLAASRDPSGNVLVEVPATRGFEGRPTVVCQAHLDMVCVKEKGSTHSFETDPIVPVRDGDHITARGTTLGADNGIGVAALVTLLESPEIPHGPLELLFTVDEEGDFSGASGLSPTLLRGTFYLNLDSEENHEFNIGCAGGQADTISIPLPYEASAPEARLFHLRLGGLLGGHSGVDIHRGRGNAIVLLARVLHRLSLIEDLRLVRLEGGTTDTAIPSEAEAWFSVPLRSVGPLLAIVMTYQRVFLREFGKTDPGVFLALDQKLPSDGFLGQALSLAATKAVVAVILSLPNGIQSMSRVSPGLPETSANVGVIKMEGDRLQIISHLQGSKLPAIRELSRRVGKAARAVGAKHVAGEPYPPWDPDLRSPLLKIAVEVHQKLFSSLPIRKVVHAGLECGEIFKKYPKMDMISFGPSIFGAHTTHERLDIASVDDFWALITTLLQTIPGKT